MSPPYQLIDPRIGAFLWPLPVIRPPPHDPFSVLTYNYLSPPYQCIDPRFGPSPWPLPITSSTPLNLFFSGLKPFFVSPIPIHRHSIWRISPSFANQSPTQIDPLFRWNTYSFVSPYQFVDPRFDASPLSLSLTCPLLLILFSGGTHYSLSPPYQFIHSLYDASPCLLPMNRQLHLIPFSDGTHHSLSPPIQVRRSSIRKDTSFSSSLLSELISLFLPNYPLIFTHNAGLALSSSPHTH